MCFFVCNGNRTKSLIGIAMRHTHTCRRQTFYHHSLFNVNIRNRNRNTHSVPNNCIDFSNSVRNFCNDAAAAAAQTLNDFATNTIRRKDNVVEGVCGLSSAKVPRSMRQTSLSWQSIYWFVLNHKIAARAAFASFTFEMPILSRTEMRCRLSHNCRPYLSPPLEFRHDSICCVLAQPPPLPWLAAWVKWVKHWTFISNHFGCGLHGESESE